MIEDQIPQLTSSDIQEERGFRAIAGWDWGEGVPCYSWVRLEVQASCMVSTDTTGELEEKQGLKNIDKEVNRIYVTVRWSNILLLESQKERGESGWVLWHYYDLKYSRSDTVPVSRLDLRSPECFTLPPGILPPPCEQPRTCLWGDERWHGPVTPVPPDERPEVWVRPWRTPHPQWASSWVQTHE